MKAKRGLLTGHKVTKNHSTITKEAGTIIEYAKKCPHVTKIVLGQIAPLGYAKPRLHFVPVLAGLRIGVRGTTSHQVLFVYTHQAEETQKYLQKEFDNHV